MRRTLKCLGLSVVGLLIVFVAISYWLLATQSGFRWLLDRAAPMVTVESINGDLVAFSFTGLKLDLPAVQIHIDEGELRWTMSALWSGTVEITQIAANNITVTPLTAEKSDKEFEPWQGVRLPVDLRLQSAKVQNLVINTSTESTINVDALWLEGMIIDDQLAIRQLELIQQDNRLKLAGSIDLSASPAGLVELENSVFWLIDEQQVSSHGKVSGTWQNLIVNQSLNTPVSIGLIATVENALSDVPSWEATLSAEQLNIGELLKNSPEQIINGSIKSSGQIELGAGFAGINATLTSELRASVIEPTDLVSNWLMNSELMLTAGDLTIKQFNAAQDEQATEQTPASISIDGVVDDILSFSSALAANTGEGSVELNGSWSNASWPMASETKSVPATDGSFRVSGVPEKYLIQLQAIGLNTLKGTRLSVTGSGNRSGVAFDSILAESEQGQLFGEGKLNWLPTLSWQTKLAMKEFNIGAFAKRWPSELSGLIMSEGKLAPQIASPLGIMGSLQIESVSGSLRGLPVTAQVDLAFDELGATINRFSLASGRSTVVASGTASSKLDLKWKITSPNLSDFHPETNGEMNADGRLTGPFDAPHVRAKLDSNRISFGAWSAGDLIADADVSLASTDDTLSVNLSASRVNHGDQLLVKKISANLSGSHEQHQAVIEASLNDQVELTVRTNGGFDESGWRGQLAALELIDSALGRWSLASPSNITASDARLDLERSCFTNAEQSVCFAAQQAANAQTISAKLKDIDISNLNHFLALYEIDVSGVLNGDLNYRKPADSGSANVTASLVSNKARIKFRETPSIGDDDSDGGSEGFRTLQVESLLVNFEQGDDLKTHWEFRLANGDNLTGELAIATPIGSPGFRSAAIKGAVNANIADLSLLPPLLLNNISLNGALNAEAQLSGSLNDPQVGMQTRMQDATVTINELGLVLRDIDLSATSRAESIIEMKGSLKSGDGELAVNGNLNFTALNNPTVEMVLRGENLTLAQTQSFGVVGDVDTVIAISKSLIELSGDVRIDSAEIDYSQSESVILASDDVVLLGDEPAARRAQQRLNLTLDLGDNTHINAVGLDARLLGRLKINQEPGGIVTAQGQIDVKGGQYQAYGQSLAIDKGRLIFSGGGIDDPGIELEAIKEVGSTNVGIRVDGRAGSPRVNLFSTPSMRDQDILSALIFGRPVGELGSEDSLTLLRIANSLRGDGPGQVAQITERLQKSLGLTNLELKLSGNAPSIVAGKQLSSKFYIGYGYGLLDAAQSLILRYKINKAWSIQGDVGVNSGADLRYQIER